MNKFIYCDGGRSNYFEGKTGYCFYRAIAIAENIDYLDAIKLVYDLSKNDRQTNKLCYKSKVDLGVATKRCKRYLRMLGYKYVSLCCFGVKPKYRTKESKLPNGSLIVKLYDHVVFVKDNVYYDTWDVPKYNHAIYGYFVKEKSNGS